MTQRIGWLNPRISSKNLGDAIIERAVGQEMAATWPDAELVQLPTQRLMTIAERRAAASCDFYVVGGTNLLNGNIPRYLQWRLDPAAYRMLAGRVLLMGVGWWQYQPTNSISSTFWRRLLGGPLHSVRDEYTKSKLDAIGLRSVNTACPTMWRLPGQIRYPRPRSAALVTLTDYNADRGRDQRLISRLRKRYDRLVFWPQGSKDLAYVDSLSWKVERLPMTVDAFDAALESGEFDYFGTRLHAGIRALQYGIRTNIVAVDNRAQEIHRDTGLPVVSPELSEEELDEALSADAVSLHLPRHSIDAWRAAVPGSRPGLASVTTRPASSACTLRALR